MRYPSLNKLPQQAISVPSLSGGLNLADSLHLVNDNQLTDVKNMWFKNSILQTRPAVKEQSELLNESRVSDGHLITNFFVDLEQTVDGEKVGLLINKDVDLNALSTYYNIQKISKGNVEWLATGQIKHKVESECFFTAKPTSKYNHISDAVNGFGSNVELEGTGIFMHISYMMENANYKKVTALCEIVKSNAWVNFGIYHYGSEDYYSPIVYINGKGDSYSELPINDNTEYAPASFYEGYSEYYQAIHKFCFTTDGVSKTYTLPITLEDKVIKITLNDTGKWYSNETFIDSRTLEEGGITVNLWYYGDPEEQTQYTCIVNKNSITFQSTLPLNALNNFENNLVIEVSDWNDNLYNQEMGKTIKDSKLYGANICKWFGGTGKGTRLFLSGTKDEHKNIVMWSKVNDPSYISENNYNYVGTSAQRITALHKQSDMLVIFKEDELFYTEYTGQQEITASQVTSGAIIDIETNSSVFPFYQIHSEIGCDIPKSIQLCGNRLVWATNKNKIYTLKSANQYSNANVFELSQTIERRLRTLTDEEIKLCKSCVYDGYYILSFDNKSFVLNIENYYYKNTSAYADSRQQNRKFEWSYWEYPKEQLRDTFCYVDAAGCHILNLYVFTSLTDDGYPYSYLTCKSFILTDDQDKDEYYDIHDLDETGASQNFELKQAPINSLIQTKLFDFGLPDRYKKIEQVYVGFGEIAGTTKISYITDNGTKEAGTIEFIGESNDYSPEYIKTKRLLPCINRANKFGIKFDCKGRIALSDLIIKYKFIGGVR